MAADVAAAEAALRKCSVTSSTEELVAVAAADFTVGEPDADAKQSSVCSAATPSEAVLAEKADSLGKPAVFGEIAPQSIPKETTAACAVANSSIEMPAPKTTSQMTDKEVEKGPVVETKASAEKAPEAAAKQPTEASVQSTTPKMFHSWSALANKDATMAWNSGTLGTSTVVGKSVSVSPVSSTASPIASDAPSAAGSVDRRITHKKTYNFLRCLYARGLPDEVDVAALRREFSKMAPVRDLQLGNNYAIVEYESEEAAKKALAAVYAYKEKRLAVEPKKAPADRRLTRSPPNAVPASVIKDGFGLGLSTPKMHNEK